jgi:type IV pilus assembly protein PilB
MKRCQKRLGELLLDGNAIKTHQLELALEHQKRWGGKLAAILIEMGIANERTVASFLGRQCGWKWIALENTHIPSRVLQLVDSKIAQKYKIIPLSFNDGRLTIATSNPIDCKMIDEISFILGLNGVRTVFAMESSIEHALKKFYHVKPENAQQSSKVRPAAWTAA